MFIQQWRLNGYIDFIVHSIRDDYNIYMVSINGNFNMISHLILMDSLCKEFIFIDPNTLTYLHYPFDQALSIIYPSS